MPKLSEVMLCVCLGYVVTLNMCELISTWGYALHSITLKVVEEKVAEEPQKHQEKNGTSKRNPCWMKNSGGTKVEIAMNVGKRLFVKEDKQCMLFVEEDECCEAAQRRSFIEKDVGNTTNDILIARVGSIELEVVFTFDRASKSNLESAKVGNCLYIPNKDSIHLFGCGIGRKTNNATKYANTIQGLKLSRDLGIKSLLLQGDSKLVLNQISKTWNKIAWHLEDLFNEAPSLLSAFDHVPRPHCGHHSPKNCKVCKFSTREIPIASHQRRCSSTTGLSALEDAMLEVRDEICSLKEMVKAVFSTYIHMMHVLSHLNTKGDLFKELKITINPSLAGDANPTRTLKSNTPTVAKQNPQHNNT
eukprot:Gb_40044 [translate_table: standard]